MKKIAVIAVVMLMATSAWAIYVERGSGPLRTEVPIYSERQGTSSSTVTLCGSGYTALRGADSQVINGADSNPICVGE